MYDADMDPTSNARHARTPSPPRSSAQVEPPWTVEPALEGSLGVRLAGFDVREADEGLGTAIKDLVYEHKLVAIEAQEVTDPEYIEFARALGEPQIYFQPNYHHPDHPEIFVSSNVPMEREDEDGQRVLKKVGVAGTGRYWHTDYQFFPRPLPLTMITPRVLPQGNRGTYYVDMERVLEGLPAELAPLVEGTRAVHEAKWRYKIQASDIDKSITEILEEFGAETPTVTHPTVITHPRNGRRLLYVSRGFTVAIDGLTHEENAARLPHLFDYVERAEHVRFQPWRDGDILLWDNRQVIHMASPSGGGPSTSYRIGVYDGLPFNADEREGRLR